MSSELGIHGGGKPNLVELHGASEITAQKREGVELPGASDSVEKPAVGPSRRARIMKTLKAIGRVVRKAAIVGAIIGAMAGGALVVRHQIQNAPKNTPVNVEQPHEVDPSTLPAPPGDNTNAPRVTLPSPPANATPPADSSSGTTLRNGRLHEIRSPRTLPGQ